MPDWLREPAVGCVWDLEGPWYSDNILWLRPTAGSRCSDWRGPVATSAKGAEQFIELGESGGGMSRGNFFFDNAKCCKLGHFYHFCQAFDPPWPPHRSRLCRDRTMWRNDEMKQPRDRKMPSWYDMIKRLKDGYHNMWDTSWSDIFRYIYCLES